MGQPTDEQIYIPTEPGKRHEPLVGPGVPVWSIVGYLKLFEWDVRRVVQEFEDALSADQVMAAWDYYKRNAEEIEAKLRLNEFPV